MMKNQIPSWSRAGLESLSFPDLQHLGTWPGVSHCSALFAFRSDLCWFGMVLSPVDAFVGCQEPRGSPAGADGGAWRRNLPGFLGKAFSRNLGAAPRLFLSLQRFLWADSWCCQKIEDLRFLPALLNFEPLQN